MFLVPDAIYVLTIPIIYPVLIELGYDPIWFGIVTIKLSEIALVTPPVGLNLFTIQGALGKGITFQEVAMGIWPYVACDIIVLIMITIFPQIVLWLPTLLFR